MDDAQQMANELLSRFGYAPESRLGQETTDTIRKAIRLGEMQVMASVEAMMNERKTRYVEERDSKLRSLS